MAKKQISLFGEFIKGLFKENPALVLALGLCPTLAVTTGIENAIGMGLSTTAVLLGSNIVVSLLKNLIPSKVRIPAFIVIIATFVTIIDMLLQAYFPGLYAALGLFIPLIVVNCIILARAEAFASKNGVVRSIIDGLGMGLGFTGAIMLIAGVRELLGTGMLMGKMILPVTYNPAIMMILPPGAFITLGLVLAFINHLARK